MSNDSSGARAGHEPEASATGPNLTYVDTDLSGSPPRSGPASTATEPPQGAPAENWPTGSDPPQGEPPAQVHQLGLAMPSHMLGFSAPPLNYFQIPQLTLMNMPAATDPASIQALQAHYISAAQAPPYLVSPSSMEASSLGQRESRSLRPGHASPFALSHTYPHNMPRNEPAAGIPPEQQYDEYMQDAASLGLAAALYHDSPIVPNQPPRHSPGQSPIHIDATHTAAGRLQSRSSPEAAAFRPFLSPSGYDIVGPAPSLGYSPSEALAPPAPDGLATHVLGSESYARLEQSHNDEAAQPSLPAAPYSDQKRPRRTSFKYHECSVCGKKFGRPSALQTHLYSHTGEKPYKCRFPDCSRRFSVLSNLRRHQRIHHGTSRTGSTPPE